MKKNDITKKGTEIFQGRKIAVFSKATGWPLLVGLLLVLIAGSAFVTAGGKPGGHPAGAAKAKPAIHKLNGAFLPQGAPTLSYSGPHTYLQGQTVLLAPTSSGVAPLAYSTTATPYGSGFNQPLGVATDGAGNVYVGDGVNGIIKIPPGNVTPVHLPFGEPNSIAADAAGDLYVAYAYIVSDDDDGGYWEYDVYKIQAGSNTQTLVESNFAFEPDTNVEPYNVAADAAGNLYMVELDGNDYNTPGYPLASFIDELPAGSKSTHTVYAGDFFSTVITCDGAGNVYYFDIVNGGIVEIPGGNGAPVRYPGLFGGPNSATQQPAAITFDAAGNLYAAEWINGGAQLQMVAAGNLSGTPVTIGPALSNPTGIAADGAGNIYVSNYNYANNQPGNVSQIKPAGGYFITPALPAGLHFDSNTGIISGRVTAPAGAATTYTITAYNGGASTSATVSLRVLQGSSDADLIHLIPTRGVLSPQFAAATTSYTASVVYGVRSFQLTPITASPHASITINGTAIADSATTAPLALKPGVNNFNIVVTAPDQVTTKTYSLTVNRPVSNNASLLSLTRSAGVISPVFSATTTSYTTSVANGVHTMTITPTASDQEAIIKVNGAVVASGSTSAPISLPLGQSTITIAVTATDGTTVKTYTLTVTRPPSVNDNLSGITVTPGTISPVFNPANGNYTVSLANSQRAITVSGFAADPDATVTINGRSAGSGGGYYFSSLPVGSSTVLITVKASDKTTLKTYVVTINRASSNNANLSDFFTNAAPVSPDFSSSITNYTSTANYGQKSIALVPFLADPDATITINGKTAVSGQLSASIPLSVGTNTINMVVTASDKITSKTYTLTETRLPPSNNADLSNLWCYQATLSPGFSASITNYTLAVPFATTSINVGEYTADTYATVNVNGTTYTSGQSIPAIALSVGSKAINFVVTATDGVTTKTYTLTATRLPPSNNAGLSNLTCSAGALSPAFTTANTDYTILVYSSVSSVSVTPTVAYTTAKLAMNGVAATSGVAKTFALTTGANAIKTVVTAEDGTTTNTYTINVNRLSPSANPPDESLSVSNTVEKPTLNDDVIIVHQGISPNGDGINDFLIIDGILAYPDNKLTIMNRNGQSIFESKGYDNAAKVFDGHSNKTGQMQLPGTYFYQLDYTVKDIVKHKTGFIVLKY